ncbi:hypothetical protein F5X97DRAFT_195115 [Nemania serpens]|nr:hypothetical protein F5X97DRAFT_195115 [Nemania serpens]
MLTVVAIFVLGSGVCGGASSSSMLIAGRAVHGVGSDGDHHHLEHHNQRFGASPSAGELRRHRRGHLRSRIYAGPLYCWCHHLIHDVAMGFLFESPHRRCCFRYPIYVYCASITTKEQIYGKRAVRYHIDAVRQNLR